MANQGLDPGDPVQAELMALRDQVQALQQGYEGIEDHQANAWLDQETAQAAQIFEGLELPFDPDELYQYAAERELTDVSSAAKALAFDKMMAASGQPGPLPPEFAQYDTNGGQSLAPSGVPQRPGLGAQERFTAAAQTPRSGMTSASQPSFQPPPGTIQESFAQTLRDLGVTSLDQVDMTS